MYTIFLHNILHCIDYIHNTQQPVYIFTIGACYIVSICCLCDGNLIIQSYIWPSVCLSAPCAPEILNLTQVNSTAVQVLWRATNKQATYTVKAFGSASTLTCSSTNTSCGIKNLLCGSSYEVSVYATTTVGHSLPSYSIAMETGKVLKIENR